MEKILFVIPAYNEEKSILDTVNKIYDYNKKHNKNYELIVINDGSKDNTEKILCDNNIPHVKLIHNLGIGGAVQTGYKYALEHGYDIAIQFDADGQHDINSVESLINPIIKEKVNLVIGSRFIEKDSSKFKSTFARLIGIRIISFFMKIFTKKKIYDVTSGYRACDKKTIEHFSHTYPIEYPEPVSTVDLFKNGFKIKEVPVNMVERQGGTSSIHSWKKAYYMVNVILSMFVLWLRGENHE